MKKDNFIIFIAYSILTIVFTYPVAFSSNEMIPGHGDVFQFLWFFWLFKEALLNFTSPYYTDYIFYPSGISLAFSTITPLNSIVSIPLQLGFGLVNAYKILWLLTFILSGFGAFLLVKHLTNDTRAAFVAGMIFMFCPYRFAHALGHMNLISTQWIPFYLLFLIKSVKENKMHNTFLAGIFLFLTAISCYYYLIYLFMFTFIYILYRQLSYKDIFKRSVINRLGIMTLTFSIIVFPFMYPLIREILFSRSDYMYGGEFVKYSADLLGFFIPHVFHPLFKDFVSPIYSNFSGGPAEYTVFIGYTVILLSILCLLKVNYGDVKFWALSAFLFFILSLGPILHINGISNFLVKGYNLYIPLPYAVLMHIPIFSMARVPSRWDILVMISLAVLSGYGLNYLFSKYRNNKPNSKHKINIIFIFISCLILFEFLSVPYLMSSAEIPTFYKEISNDQEDYAILEVPILGYTEPMFYQTLHGKRIIGGFVSRVPYEKIEFLESTPLIRDLLYLYPSEDIIKHNLSEVGPAITSYYNISYIIVHKDRLTTEQLNFTYDLINNFLIDNIIFYENDFIVVYKLKNEHLVPFLSLNRGWHYLENWMSTPTRWISDDASLLIYSKENDTIEMSFQAISFNRLRTLEIYVNDDPWIWAEVPTDGFVVVKFPMNLNRGINIVNLKVPEGCERPCDIPELNIKDSRCLSVAIQNIEINKEIQTNENKIALE